MAIEPTLTAAMDCSELERSVDAYLDGEFDARERGEADAHLADCDRCRALAEAQGRIRAAVRAKLREAMTPDSDAGHAPPARCASSRRTARTTASSTTRSAATTAACRSR